MKVSTVLTVLCLLVASAAIAHAQVSCYNIMMCGGVGTSFATARECCLSDSSVAYNNGTGCIECIVFGWIQSTLEGDESSRDVQEAQIGYIKGSGGRITVTLSFMDAPSGTPSAKSTDVMINTPSVSIPPSSFPRFDFRISFSADSIAQEGTERAILRLALADNSAAPAGSFLRSDLELVIHDRDVIVIQFDQDDYANNEVDLLMPLTVAKNLVLANPVSLQILPVTVDQASRLPANLPADNNTFSPNRAKITPENRRDFSSEMLTLTFPADEGNDTIVNQIRRTIALVDDPIDEADVEFFVILLEVTDSTDQSLINVERNVALGRISDNDQITIGFEFESYDFMEPQGIVTEAGQAVYLLKENNVTTEQTYQIVFQLSASVPNNSIGVATRDVDYVVENIHPIFGAEIQFPADQQRYQVFVQGFTFLLFPDNTSESTEAFQVTTGPGERGPRYIPPAANSKVFANSFMIIFDDVITIGWVNTSFTVREDIGTFEACYRVFVPAPQEMFNQFTIMVVDTRAGTADDNDYLPLMAGEENFVNDENRERCATITIEDDNVLEETEEFSIELSESRFSSVNPRVMPNLANITIVDTTRLMIGFIGAPYQAGEDMGPMVFTVGVIGGTTLADGVEVVVFFSTVAQAPPGRELATDGSDYVGRSNVLLTFNSTTREIQVPVDLIDDSVFEMEEDFTGTLTLISSSVGTERVSIGPQTAIATIVDDEIVCQELAVLVNGLIDYFPDMIAPYDEDTEATHICNTGFALVGNLIRTCQNDSFFDGDPPTCEPIECEPLPRIENGFITYASDTSANYELQTIATYDCNFGYVLDLSGGGSQTRECVDDIDGDVLGVFNRQAPICIPVCQDLGVLVNGRIEYSPDMTAPYDEGTVATHICNPGFALVGNVIRTCQNDTFFDGSPPTCQSIQCLPLPQIENGFITYGSDNIPNYELGTIATYDCNTGFVLDFSGGGSRTRECIDDGDGDVLGVFNRQAPRCVPVCQDLGTLVNGRIEYFPDMIFPYDVGTVATHICNTGFALVGNVIRTCRNNTFFDGSPPTCEPIECVPLPSIANGVITYAPDNTPNYALGTNATYTCNNGFTLDLSGGGSRMRTCIDDGDGDALGVFDRQAPACRLFDIVRVNDTVIGDPLMTVPLYVQNKSAIMPLGEDDIIHLCFEVHGRSDAYFNLVSDNCVSVNAHYRRIRPNEDINIIDNIAIRAVGSDGVCRNINVSLDQCTARMDRMVISSFSAAGISVRKFSSRVRITVPNCGSVNGLVMWVMCQTQTFWSTSQVDPAGNEVTFQDEAIRFVIARGLNLRQTSHGILGQFWNIPIEVVPYNGPFIEAPEPGIATYSVNINYPGVTPRSFVAWLRFPSWELERGLHCLYAGDGHAGSVYEVPEGPSNGPVIEGAYTDYIIAEQFGTEFTHSHFESMRCGSP